MTRHLAISRLFLLLLTALWISLVPNFAALKSFMQAPSAGSGLQAWAFVAGGWLFVLAVTFTLLLALSGLFWGRTIKVLCGAMLLLAAVLGYFTLFLGTQFDKTMLVNILQTNTSESLELLNLRMVLWIVVTGVLPALLVWHARLRPPATLRRTLAVPVVVWMVLVAISVAAVFAMYSRYASAVRNRAVSFHTMAPVNAFAAGVSHGYAVYASSAVRALRGQDARQGYAIAKPRLVVFVLGETARAQSVGLNSYERDTTPRMRAAGGYYFPDTESCGTATAISVPCIFSGFSRQDFSLTKGRSNETLIDVVARSGARVIWRDNDSGCKGVCDKADYTDFTPSSDPRWCPEPDNCFDEILLDGLESKLRSGNQDTLLVLHLKGSHGPAYFKRYPKAFERYVPTCMSSDLAACDPQAIRNAYDNTIAYTDHVVGEVVKLLGTVSDQFATAMLYASDHGESLGEAGLYLHGLPYALAPREQTRVPLYAWVSPPFIKMERWDAACMVKQTRVPRSHDNIYATLLGMMEIETVEYKRDRDLFEPCDDHAGLPGDPARGRPLAKP